MSIKQYTTYIPFGSTRANDREAAVMPLATGAVAIRNDALTFFLFFENYPHVFDVEKKKQCLCNVLQ